MSTATLTSPGHVPASAGGPRFTLPKFGMLVFLASEAMLLPGSSADTLFCVWLKVRETGHPLEPGNRCSPSPTFLNWVMIVNTVILLSSSLTFHWGEVRMRKGGSGLIGYSLTALLGAVFLGVQAWEWHHLKGEGMWFDSFGTYGSCFFTMTGFHGLHVFLGLLGVLWVAARAGLRQMKLFSGQAPNPSHTFEELTGYYWHFVDVVWIFLYSILYVL